MARDRRDALIHAGNVTAGAAAVMIVTLFSAGPGTLFPIAIVFGIAILAVGSYLGALVTFPFKAPSRAAAMGAAVRISDGRNRDDSCTQDVDGVRVDRRGNANRPGGLASSTVSETLRRQSLATNR